MIHISDKIDFKIKAVKREKDGHYIMILRILVNAWSLAAVAMWTASDGHPSLMSVIFVGIL